MAEYMEFGEEMGQRGVLTGGERLRPTTDATTVRVRDGEVLTSDGPFAETKEQMGGFYIVDCKDLDEAIEVAVEDPRRARRLDRGAADLGDVSCRRRGRGRDGVPRRVGPRRRDADPRHRRLGPRRGMRAGRLHAGARDVGRATASRAIPARGSPRRRATARSTGCAAPATGAAKLQEVAVLVAPEPPGPSSTTAASRTTACG